MMNASISKRHIYIFLIYLIINISLSLQKYKKYQIEIAKNQNELSNLYITDDSFNQYEDPCTKWIPSLFNPILLIPKINLKGEKEVIKLFTLDNPIFYGLKELSLGLFKNSEFLEYKLYSAKEIYPGTVKECYFGISSGLCNYNELDINNINLNNLNKEENKKIFSFDKWDINDNFFINTAFYFGDIHEIFNSKDGIIGNCANNPNSFSWGCLFDEMIFNNEIIPLKDNNGHLYNIYYSSEIYTSIFPQSFKDEFEEKSNKTCEYKKEISRLVCNLFNGKDYIDIKFKNENMTITGELDSEIRFNEYNRDKINNIRIIFKDVNYIILPLIIFKNFHIQFNAENNIISFYSENSTILQVKKEQQEDNNYSFSIKIVFLIILIVVLILVIGFLIFRVIKAKNLKVEKSINKFNKFEDEEDFHNINENRVF